MPARRDALRSIAGEAAGIPSFVDVLFAPHRRWVLDAECAKPDYEKYRWVIEKSGGIENPPTVVKLFEVCKRCPVRRRCLMDALTEEAVSIVGCWGGTMASEHAPVMRRIAEQLTEPDEMTFANSFGAPTSSVVAGSPMHRVDRAKLAEEVADELERSLPDRIRWWEAKESQVLARRTMTPVGDTAEASGTGKDGVALPPTTVRQVLASAPR